MYQFVNVHHLFLVQLRINKNAIFRFSPCFCYYCFCYRMRMCARPISCCTKVRFDVNEFGKTSLFSQSEPISFVKWTCSFWAKGIYFLWPVKKKKSKSKLETDYQNFVKDTYVNSRKITRNGRKMAIYQLQILVISLYITDWGKTTLKSESVQ